MGIPSFLLAFFSIIARGYISPWKAIFSFFGNSHSMVGSYMTGSYTSPHTITPHLPLLAILSSGLALTIEGEDREDIRYAALSSILAALSAVSTSLEADFCLLALERAFQIGCPEIFNTDQGSQFTSTIFIQKLKEQQI